MAAPGQAGPPVWAQEGRKKKAITPGRGPKRAIPAGENEISETNDDQSEPRRIPLEASVYFVGLSSDVALQTTPTKRIEVEDAENLKYVGCDQGTSHCPRRCL